MRGKIFVGVAATFAALFLGAAPVGANGGPPPFQCNTTVNGGSINSSVRVPAGGVCILNSVTVNGSVTADTNSYFESNGSTISGNVVGNLALTLYIYNHSAVNGDVAGNQAPQLFLYNSTFAQNISASNAVAPGYGHFQLCGSTVGHDVSASQVGPDVLIGAPAAGCGANTISGNVTAYGNAADTEVYVIGNTLSRGDLTVTNNAGVGDKRVNNNTVSGDLTCSGNSAPIDCSNNVVKGTVTM